MLIHPLVLVQIELSPETEQMSASHYWAAIQDADELRGRSDVRRVIPFKPLSALEAAVLMEAGGVIEAPIMDPRFRAACEGACVVPTLAQGLIENFRAQQVGAQRVRRGYVAFALGTTQEAGTEPPQAVIEREAVRTGADDEVVTILQFELEQRHPREPRSLLLRSELPEKYPTVSDLLVAGGYCKDKKEAADKLWSKDIRVMVEGTTLMDVAVYLDRQKEYQVTCGKGLPVLLRVLDEQPGPGPVEIARWLLTALTEKDSAILVTQLSKLTDTRDLEAVWTDTLLRISTTQAVLAGVSLEGDPQEQLVELLGCFEPHMTATYAALFNSIRESLGAPGRRSQRLYEFINSGEHRRLASTEE